MNQAIAFRIAMNGEQDNWDKLMGSYQDQIGEVDEKTASQGINDFAREFGGGF
jgi:hypothetical protein